MNNRLTVSGAQKQLEDAGVPYKVLFKHGTLEVELYKPNKVDLQTPHTRDEIYVIATGNGWLMNGGERQPANPGDVLFVIAGVEHRFENFSDDFSTWVFFYGPEGGERI